MLAKYTFQQKLYYEILIFIRLIYPKAILLTPKHKNENIGNFTILLHGSYLNQRYTYFQATTIFMHEQRKVEPSTFVETCCDFVPAKPLAVYACTVYVAINIT